MLGELLLQPINKALQEENGRKLINAACKSGNNLAAVQKLLDDGADVNWKDTLGSTASMYACYQGDVEVIKLLMDRGADTDIQDKDGWTALMYASHNGKVECARLLLEKGADMSFRDKTKKSRTAKDIAKENGCVDIVHLLNEVRIL